MAEQALEEETTSEEAEIIYAPLLAGHFKLAEHSRSVYYANTEAPLEAVVKGEFWRHVANRLRPFDRIEVVHEGMEYFVELFVRDADKHSVNLAVMREVEMGGSVRDSSILSRLRVDYKGTSKRHCVILRDESGKDTIVAEGHQTKRGAEHAMLDYSRRFSG